MMAMLLENKALPGSRKIPALREFSVRFLAWLKELPVDRPPKEGTRKYYRQGWALLANTKLVGMRIDQISTDDVRATAVGSSPANTNNALRTLRHMLQKAHEWRLIPSVPGVKMVEESGRDQILEPWMEQKLLLIAEQPLRDVLLIMLDTGMRPGEVFRMEWENVKWDRDMIFVPRSKSRKSKRFVGLTERVRELLQVRAAAWKDTLSKRGARGNRVVQLRAARWSSPLTRIDGTLGAVSRLGKETRCDMPRLESRNDSDKSRPSAGINPCPHDNFVFPSKRSASGHLETVQKQWETVKKLAGLPDSVVLYCARHRFSTDAMEGTGNVMAVMDVMGHSRVDVTRVYQHPGLKQVTAAIEKRNERVQ
jgi:integrase